MDFNNKIISFIRDSAIRESDVLMALANNVKSRRLEKNLTQKDLSKKLNICLPTYRKFEQTGNLSLKNFVKIAIFFEETPNIKKLFTQTRYESIEDVLKASKPPRKRARKQK